MAGGGNALTITGAANIDGAYSGITNLSINGASNIGADITTTGAQTYSGAVTLRIGGRTWTDRFPIGTRPANGWSAALRHDSPTEQLINRGNRASQWIALSRDPAKLAELTGKVDKVKSRYYNSEQWLQLDAPGKTSPWTDDYASTLPILLWGNLIGKHE